MQTLAQIQCPIARHSASDPEKTAILVGDTPWSYAQCNQAIHTLQYHLRNHGVTANSIVAWTPVNSLFDVLLFWALIRENAIAFPLSDRHPIKQKDSLYKSTHVTHVISHDTDWYLDTSSCTKKRKFIPQEHLEKKIHNPINLPENLPPTLLSPAALTNYTLTSGTTSTPKVAVHSLNNHYQNALNANQVLSLTQESSWLWSLPLSHVSGLSILFRVFLAKAQLVISKDSLRATLSSGIISHVSVVPTQLYRLMQSPSTDWATPLSCIMIGGAAVSAPLEEEASYLPCHVFKTYGLTELAAQVQMQDIKNPDTLFPSHAQLKLDKDGHILIKSPCLFKGYLAENQTITCEKIDGEWFQTGDHGKLLPTGHMEILGRKDNLFISGGENIQPEEIEETIRSINYVNYAIVLPETDPEFGERPIAIISPHTPKTLEAVQSHLDNTLPKFKHPIRYIEWPNHIPKSDKLPRTLLSNWITSTK